MTVHDEEMAAFHKAHVAKARRMRGKRFALAKLTWKDCLILQDAVDDFASDAGRGVTGVVARRLRTLQRKLHTLTGEEMPPSTQAARRANRRQNAFERVPSDERR